MAERMVGKVRFCNPVSGVGMVEVEGMGDVFFHVNDLPIADGFMAILPGKKFGFSLVTSGEGKHRAKEIKLIEGTGVPHYDWPATRTIALSKEGVVFLRVDAIGRVVASDGKPVRPTASADGFVRAYYMGIHQKGDFRGFTLKLPVPTSSQAVVLADTGKAPRKAQSKEYEQVRPGSYLVSVNSKGEAVVYTIGVRHQSIPGVDKSETKVQLWIVIYARYRQQFNLGKGIIEEAMKAQITSGGMDRDNDGFARAISVAFQRMADAARKPASVKA